MKHLIKESKEKVRRTSRYPELTQKVLREDNEDVMLADGTILHLENGLLHGAPAVEGQDGHLETWCHGCFVGMGIVLEEASA